MDTCTECNQEFDKRRADQKFCSKRCRERSHYRRAREDGRYEQWREQAAEKAEVERLTRPPKFCRMCGVELTGGKRVLCGRACTNAYKRIGIGEYQRRPEIIAKRQAKDTCRCGAEKWKSAALCRPCSAAKAARAKSVAAKLNPRILKPRAFVEGPCSVCGERFMGLAAMGSTCSVWCQKAKKAERATAKAWEVSPRIRLLVFERDGWVCQLCHEPLDRGADPLSDWYPSLDHIVPRSKGGGHDPENLRATHRWCNAIRGAEDYHADLFVAS